MTRRQAVRNARGDRGGAVGNAQEDSEYLHLMPDVCGLAPEFPFRMSQAVRDGLPRLVGLVGGQSIGGVGEAPLCRPLSFRRCRWQARPILLVSGPEIAAAARTYPRNYEQERVSGLVHCVCHADDGASTTRSGRCQFQLKALGSRTVPPPIITGGNRCERKRREANKGLSGTILGGHATHTSIGSSLFC
ncbi:hypothetical protein ABIB85_007668 [Bradyrhizobium sp. JR1.5]